MTIRPYAAGDAAAVADILEPIIRAGETLAHPRDMSRAAMVALWTGPDRAAFVAEIEGRVAGVCYLKANQAGGGGHVANAGYATAAWATGRGLARALCAFTLDHARTLGFAAMQFNLVVETNARAVALWTAMGFETVGRLPGAFDHPAMGRVDALVMYRKL